MVTSFRSWTAAQILMCALGASTAWAQAVAGPEKARQVQGDPGISSMVVLDLRRGTQRREALLQEYARTQLLRVVEPLEPLDLIRLQDCLRRLPERERSVMVLTFYQEESSDSLAFTLGLTSANARVIRHRALRRLRDCMESVP